LCGVGLTDENNAANFSLYPIKGRYAKGHERQFLFCVGKHKLFSLTRRRCARVSSRLFSKSGVEFFLHF